MLYVQCTAKKTSDFGLHNKLKNYFPCILWFFNFYLFSFFFFSFLLRCLMWNNVWFPSTVNKNLSINKVSHSATQLQYVLTTLILYITLWLFPVDSRHAKHIKGIQVNKKGDRNSVTGGFITADLQEDLIIPLVVSMETDSRNLINTLRLACESLAHYPLLPKIAWGVFGDNTV